VGLPDARERGGEPGEELEVDGFLPKARVWGALDS
jgi:hypothetical protein